MSPLEAARLARPHVLAKAEQREAEMVRDAEANWRAAIADMERQNAEHQAAWDQMIRNLRSV